MKNIFISISKQVYTNKKIKLQLIKQLPLKSHVERLVHYICIDNKTKKQYMLTVGFTYEQKIRLKRAVDNILNFKNYWGKYYNLNLPIYYDKNTEYDIYFALYTYFENGIKSDSSTLELYETLDKISNENKEEIILTDETREKILDDIVYERCPYDSETIEKFKNTEGFLEVKNILKKYDRIDVSLAFGDMKEEHILRHDNKKYLIGFDFGGIKLPLGFDKYCAKKMKHSNDLDDIPYQDFHQALCRIHHVSSSAPWLKHKKPLIEIDNNFLHIEIKDDNKTIKLEILKSSINPFLYIIDFNNIRISPYAVLELKRELEKKYINKFKAKIKFKHCPFFFDTLKQDGKNQLSYSGVISKESDQNRSKTFTEKLKSLQAYVCYSQILPYVKPYWGRVLLAFLICIPIGSLDAVIALALKPYMDLVMVEKTVFSPWYIPCGIVAFTIIQGILNYTAIYLNTWVGGKITNDLKADLYKKMLSLGTSFFDKRNSGDIIYRFHTDADTACSGLLNNLKTFISRFFSSVSLVGVLFYNSWQLALIAVVILICAFAPVANIRKRIKSVMEKSVAATATVITAYNESYMGNKTIISYNLKNFQEEKFNRLLKNIFSLRIKITQRTSWLSPMMHIIISIGIGITLGYGSHLIVTKQITSGNFVSFISALLMLYTPLKNIGNNINAVQFSFMAIERVFKILNQSPSIIDKENAIKLEGIKDVIEFKDVSFEYIKNKPVLKHINLTVKKGETIAFVGNSGGGKTTIINLIPRFYDIQSGSITIDGINIKDYTLESLRQNIAVVFQDNFLFSGTIKENIMLGNKNAAEEDIRKVVKMAYLDEFIATLQDGLDTQIGERGILLSGGQKQRVAIARAFLKNAPIIILDEATSALDNKAEAIVQMAIDNLMKDKTVFVIAHRLSTIQNANKIVVINQGEIAEQGTHSELLQIENGEYKALYEIQFKKQENLKVK